MVVTSWTFLRGAAAVMAADLASQPSTGLEVQLCGDAHLANFGLFASPDRRLLFDVNDFDETERGPFEWDLKRLAASAFVAARAAGHRDADAGAAAQASIAGYRTVIRRLAEADTMDAWYFRVEFDDVVRRLRQASLRSAANQARRSAWQRTSLRAFDKLTAMVDGRRRFVADPPLVVPLPESSAEQTIERLRALFGAYRATLPGASARLLARYRGTDVAQKVVGVGSVGTRAFVVLLQGGDGEPLLLQVKEASASVVAAHLGDPGHTNQGARVVEGQRLIQGASDVLLGWTSALDERDRPTDFYVRQLHDRKGAVEIESLNARGLGIYAGLCGAVLARAHARSGDAAAIAGYIGSSDRVDRALARFARAYADQTNADHQALRRAIDEGVVDAEPVYGRP
jgi:uncharacterized protein (DUF2252 family)